MSTIDEYSFPVDMHVTFSNPMIDAGVFIDILLSFLSFQRNHVWRNNVTLWEDVIQKSPYKKRVLTNLGLSYMRVNRYDEALSVFNRFDLLSYDV